MSPAHSKREFGRGERVLPGLWRLRLTLPWPGVPHCNAWAIQSGEGIVLVDCGMHEQATDEHPSSITQLEHAMAQVNLRLDDVRQLVITHAHSDHWGQAAPVIARSGAELWMHPNHRHGTEGELNREGALARRAEIGRPSGVPEQALQAYLEKLLEVPSGVAEVVTPDHDLVDGVEIESDLGSWRVYETPGHAPSHICLHQPEHRILISGDHLLGRISLYYDYGWTPDPIGEFLNSLEIVDRLDARLALSGHGRTFTDVRAHVLGTQAAVAQRLEAARDAVAAGRTGATALQLAPFIYGEQLTQETAGWRLAETLCVLTHLERRGQITRESDGGVERWQAAT
jgi:glyoxylase-like metal-dependent hydrolase (beta-lactamase superfamily II)